MKKTLQLALIVLLALPLAVGQPLGGPRGGSLRAAARITREVRHELLMLPNYTVFDNLEYSVKNHTITLQGQVTHPILKSDAENVVKQIEGVERIVNRIEVLPVSPADDRLRRAEYLTLFSERSPLFRYGLGAVPQIHILVKNGHVTLAGVVNNSPDKDAAGLLANQVSGVFSVKNNLRVEKG